VLIGRRPVAPNRKRRRRDEGVLQALAQALTVTRDTPPPNPVLHPSRVRGTRLRPVSSVSPAPARPVLVRVEPEGDFARVTLVAAERRNTLSATLMRELLVAVREVGASDARGLLLAAEGPVFCAGHDFADMVDADLTTMRELLKLCTELMTALQSLPQPVLARVQGLAVAAGCQLVATADLAIASEDAGFAIPGGKGGWFCHTPLVAVTRAVPRKRALELAFTGDVIDAHTAAEWGLVNAVVPADELDAACLELLHRATRGSRDSKALGKQGFYAQAELPQHQAYAHAIELMAAASQTPSARENMAAFLEKRRPSFD
jgi:enoyl-CoA hydratase/carnithine racemase